jgi:DNA-nicking Smr family endonuclease
MAKRSPSPQRDPFDPFDAPVADTIDLHGFRADEAKQAVATFIATARRRSPGAVVHIITGRGRGSPGRPVLRGAIRTLLKSGTIDGVGEFVPDHADGGFLVKLKT